MNSMSITSFNAYWNRTRFYMTTHKTPLAGQLTRRHGSFQVNKINKTTNKTEGKQTKTKNKEKDRS